MSFVSRFLRGEVTLWKSFWFGAFLAGSELWGSMFGHFIMPMPSYRYSNDEAIVRISLLITYIALHFPFFYGTWKSANSYEGNLIWKVIAKLVCGFFMFFSVFGMFIQGMDLFTLIKHLQ
jgi:hypothetical protein